MGPINPHVEINVAGVVHNYQVIREMAEARGITLTVVTKALTGYEPLIDALVGAGAGSIGEAHLANLAAEKDMDVEKWMIRPPMPSQVRDVVRYADVSLNTDATVVAMLGQAAEKAPYSYQNYLLSPLEKARVKKGTHKVILMVESGDRREGIMPEDLVRYAGMALGSPGIELYGIGTEFGCVSDVVPSRESMEEFASLVKDVEDYWGIELPVVSGGSSNGLLMLAEGTLPPRINNLRVGESILTGRVANYRTPIPGAFLDPFTLSAEIIEINEKPSQPVGPRAPGEIPVTSDPRFPDNGVRRRALVAVGKQDVDIHHLTPLNPGVQILEGSSDVFVADVTDGVVPSFGDEVRPYRVGDVLTFSMDYFAILPAMVSPFVQKVTSDQFFVA